MGSSEWFGEWFGSPYYHKLYKNRDVNEAKFFLDNLIKYLKPDPDSIMMDLACGKGRHSIYLNEKGFNVVGLDLQESNIKEANQYANDKLNFYQHDMRRIFANGRFDYVFNLFTSFGYFDTYNENQETIKSIANSMKVKGKFVLDFLNPYTVIAGLVKSQIKEIEGIQFMINRKFDGEFIFKDIEFEDNGKKFHFREKVKAIKRLEFLDYFRSARLTLLDTFGNYDLDGYEANESERLIFILQK